MTSSSLEQPAPTYLVAKIRIGSNKGPVTYARDQQVFHHDDIPEARRARKEEVKQWLKSKILSEERKEWRKSTALDTKDGYGYPICDRRSAENFVKDRSLPYNYNYRAETLDYAFISEPVDQPGKFHISRTSINDVEALNELRRNDRVQSGHFKRTEEMPTHPNLAGKTSWNTSTHLTAKEKQAGLDAKTERARVSTAKVNRRLNQSQDYLGPMAQQTDITLTVRQQKTSGQFVGGPNGTFNGHHVMSPVSAVRSSTAHDASQVDGRSSRPSTHAATDADDTKNRFTNEPSRKYTTTKHSGVWELSKADGRMMWSDTGSFIHDSRGDVFTTHNPNAFNLDGPTLPRTSKSHLLKPVDHVDRR